MSVTASEEQRVALELQEFGPREYKAIMGESRISKAPRASAPECLLLLLCLHVFATAIFSGIWLGVNG